VVLLTFLFVTFRLDVFFDDFFAVVFLATNPFLTVSFLGFLDFLVRLPLAIMALPFINMLHAIINDDVTHKIRDPSQGQSRHRNSRCNLADVNEITYAESLLMYF